MSPHGVQDRKLLNGVGLRTHLTRRYARWHDRLGMAVLLRNGFSGLANGIFCGGVVLNVAGIAGSHAGGL